MELMVDSIVDGNVKSITKFGAFIALGGGRSGLVHISEISHSYVNDVAEHLSEGQEVKVKIVGIDDAGRINLSIKQTMDPPPNPQNNRSGGFQQRDGNRSGGFQQRDGGRSGGFQQRDGGRSGGFQQRDGGRSGGFQQRDGGRSGGFQQRDGGRSGGFQQRDGGRSGGFQQRDARPAPQAAAPQGSDFENMMKQFMQSADSKLSSAHLNEKKSSRRSGHR